MAVNTPTAPQSLTGYQLLTVPAYDVQPGDLLGDLGGTWCAVAGNHDTTEGETSTRSIILIPTDGAEPRPIGILASERVAVLRPPAAPALDHLYAPDGIQLDFEELRAHLHRAVTYALPHATGSSDGWRKATVEELADWMADFLTAGISPTLSNECVNGGVKVARRFLADERAKNGA